MCISWTIKCLFLPQIIQWVCGDKNLSVATIVPGGKYKIIRLEFHIKFHCCQINSRNEANYGSLELNVTFIRII